MFLEMVVKSFPPLLILPVNTEEQRRQVIPAFSLLR